MSAPESKKRTNNFSAKEVQILIGLVDKYKDRLESRKSDRTNNALKHMAWIELANEFNSESGEVFRCVKILKNKFENIKKRSKQKFADEKIYARGTGGGPLKKPKLDDVDQKVMEIIGTQMTGLPSEFDNDEGVCSIIGCTNEEVREGKSEELIQIPKNVPKQAQLSNKIVCWARSKAELAENQLLILQEEHEFKMKCMKETHKQDLDIARKESEQRQNYFAKEAELKLQILALQKELLENH